MNKRLIEDIDGMESDLLSYYESHSVKALAELVMELKHEGQDENDFIEDWINLCDGKIVNKNDIDLRIDYAMEYERDK